MTRSSLERERTHRVLGDQNASLRCRSSELGGGCVSRTLQQDCAASSPPASDFATDSATEDLLENPAGAKPTQEAGRDVSIDTLSSHSAEIKGFGKSEPPISFHAEAVNVISWLAGVVKLLWRVQPYTIAVVVGATVLSRFASLAAFLLPLKVLLLAGSEGVPRYFSLMANPDTKLFWIIGLSFAAVGSYLFGRFLKALAARLSEAGSLEVMKEANQLTLVGNQGVVGCKHFTGITALCADLVFAAVAFITIALVNPILGWCLAVLAAILYGFTTLVLARQRPSLNPLAERILEAPRDYLQELFTVSFWSAFLFILIPLLAGAGGNIIIAILSFVLVRQALRALVAAIGCAVNLAREKTLIDALISPSHQWQRSESQARRSLRSLFERKAHLAKLESALAGQFESPRPNAMRWKDSPVSGVSTFVLTFRSGPNSSHYEEQVFAPHRAHLIKNEEVLFNYIPRVALGAPIVRAQFTHGPYQCRLCDSGLGALPRAGAWFEEFLEQVWSVAPPEGLVRAYSTSHTLLHERLTPEFIDRMALAVGSKKDERALRALEAALPTICDTLSAIPLHVSTPDSVRSNVTLRGDGRVSLMIWGRWTLTPLGVYLPSKPDDTKLAAMLDRVRERRTDIPDALSPSHLRLAAACRTLERNIAEAKYAAALHDLPAILKHSKILEVKNAPSAAKAHDAHISREVTFAK